MIRFKTLSYSSLSRSLVRLIAPFFLSLCVYLCINQCYFVSRFILFFFLLCLAFSACLFQNSTFPNLKTKEKFGAHTRGSCPRIYQSTVSVSFAFTKSPSASHLCVCVCLAILFLIAIIFIEALMNCVYKCLRMCEHKTNYKKKKKTKKLCQFYVTENLQFFLRIELKFQFIAMYSCAVAPSSFNLGVWSWRHSYATTTTKTNGTLQ